ncbi:MAG TPA: AMP-binding protein [Verrucomicrobiae bacterium]|nr:AMP-binding protein [Verrucomicrobiae bacterium]
MQPYSLTIDKFLDHAAKWHGAAEVVSATAAGGATRTTYAELRERSRLTSGGLIARGLQRGDRIATLAWNTLDHLTLYYAAMGAGFVCHTLNPRLSVPQISAMVNQAADRWIAVGAGLQPLVREILALCPSVEAILLLDDQTADSSSFQKYPKWTLAEFIRDFGRETCWGDFDEETPAGLCYTSGTIGEPRGVLYTHRSNYLHTLRALQADSFAITSQDTVLVAVPMFHANGWGLPFAGPAVGARMILPGRHLEAAHLKTLIFKEGVTVAAAVHAVWLGLVEHLESEGGELPSLKRVVVGGSHCPEAVVARIEERLGVLVQTSWGMTELSPLGTIMPLDAPKAAGARGSGRPPLGLDLKLVDAAGVALSPQRNVIGRLRVKGASVADRYFGEDGSALDAEGYFDTGDLASIDDAGNLTIAGRTKDLIKSGGEWINPREIEEIVSSHPGVGLAAVIGRPDQKWGERPVLVVEPLKNCTLDRGMLLETLRGKVPDWWLPDEVIVVERIPLAATGKLDKKRLRREYGSA